MFGLVYTPSSSGSGMATAKTGSFYLTETVTLPSGSISGSRVSGTIDLGAYVNVATGQAIAIESVDFITQRGSSFAMGASSYLTGPGTISKQLVDLNPGTAFVKANNHSLIASGALNIDTINNVTSMSNDLYPDNFGPTNLSEAFLVVNDTLYLTAGIDGAAVGTAALYVTCRVRCRVVKLSTKDWMAIAIQSTAEA